MSTNPELANPPEPQAIGEEVEQAVRRCRMLVRKGRQLLRLSQTERVS
jgi:hypothetical protein